VKLGFFQQRYWRTYQQKKTYAIHIHKCMHIMLKTVHTLSFSSKEMEEQAVC